MKGAFNIISIILFTIILGILTIIIVLSFLGQKPYELEKNLEYTGIIKDYDISYFNYNDFIWKNPSFKNNNEIEKYFKENGCIALKSCILYTLIYNKPCQIGVFSIGEKDVYYESSTNFIDSMKNGILSCSGDIIQKISPSIEQHLCKFIPGVNIKNIYVDANGLYFYNITAKDAQFYDGLKLIIPKNSELFAPTIIYDNTTFISNNISGLYRVAVLNVSIQNGNCLVLLGVAVLPYLSSSERIEANEISTPLKIFDIIRKIDFSPQTFEKWNLKNILDDATHLNNQGSKSCKESPIQPCCSLNSNIIYHCNYGSFSKLCYNETKCFNYALYNPLIIKINEENGTTIRQIINAIIFGLKSNPSYNNYNIPFAKFNISNVSENEIWKEDYSAHLSNFDGRYIFYRYNPDLGEENETIRCLSEIVMQIGYAIREKNNKVYLEPIISFKCNTLGKQR